MGEFVIKSAKTGVKFDFKGADGKVLATSEIYSSLEACKNGIASVAKNAPLAAIEDQTVEGYSAEKHPKFELYTDKAGGFRFRLKARNGEIIAASSKFDSKTDCQNGISDVQKGAPEAPVADERE